MKLRVLSIAGVLAAILGVGPAVAGSFSGPYLGLTLGNASSGKTVYNAAPQGTGGSAGSPLFISPDVGGSFKQTYSGLAWGGQIGANKVLTPAMGKVLLGIEFSATSGNFSKTSINPTGALTAGAVATYNTKLRWVATFAPRLGLVFGNQLLYLKGGLAVGSVKSALANTGGTWGARAFSETSTHVGNVLGVGWETASWAPWIVGVSYDHVDLGRAHYGGKVTPTTTWPLDYTIKTHYGELGLRVSVRY